MDPRFASLLIAIGGLATATGLLAETGLLTLHNNPFSRPQIVTRPPPPPPPPPRVAPVVVLPPEEIVLDLTATMVSDSAPMVVVDGELLAIGDRIEGLKLIAVMEGKAVFARGGKKFSFSIDDDDKR